MPEAPIYGDLKVATRPLDAPQINPGVASADAFGVGEKLSRIAISQGAKDLGMGIIEGNRIRQNEIDKRTEVNALNGLNKLVDKRVNDMADLLNTSGENAIGIDKRAEEGHQKARDEIAATLKTPEEKALFNQMAAKRWTDEHHSVQNHMVREIKSYQANTFEAAIANVRLQALDSGDPAAITQAAKDMHATRERLGDVTGQDRQSLILAHQGDDTKLFGGHVQALVDANEHKAAEAFFEENKDRIHGEVRNTLQKSIAYGKVQADSQVAAAGIFDPSKSVEQMDAEADKIEDQTTQAATKQRLRAMDFNHRTAVDQEGDKLMRDALRVMNVDPAGIDAPGMTTTLARLNTVDPVRYQALMASAVRKSRGEITTTPEGYSVFTSQRSALSGALGEADQIKALQTDPNQYVDRLSTSHLEEWHKLRDSVRAGMNKATDKVPKGILSVEDKINNVLVANKIPIKPGHDGVSDPQATQVRVMVNAQVEALGGVDKVTPKQVEEILDKTMMKVTLPDPVWYNSSRTKEVPFYALPSADQVKYSPKQMSEDQRSKAKSALMKQGIANPTEPQILNVHNAASLRTKVP